MSWEPVRQWNLAAEACFYRPGDKNPPALPSALGRRGPGIGPGGQGSAASQCHRLVAPKHLNTLGDGGSMCSLIWAINHNFIRQKNTQKTICYSKGLYPFLCSYYSSSRQMGSQSRNAKPLSCIDLSNRPCRKGNWDFLERRQGSGLGTGRAV